MRGICAHFQLALVGNMSDEDEVTYDIHADGNSKLTKSLQKAKAKSAKQGKDTTAADTSTHVTCFADPHPSLGQLLRRMRRLHCEDPWRTCYDKLLLEASTVCPTSRCVRNDGTYMLSYLHFLPCSHMFTHSHHNFVSSLEHRSANFRSTYLPKKNAANV
ncbi:hypothetical protein DYB34_007648 [Aphanomyces astaci]|uniref:Uncharacterized protein n=1 Tax=Aphanomyces astaci TaxID=112090 RepID=A0A3R6WB08_APHAT|nr:hypothetical protein DYB34_007648 [Aphanomyces astaci]